MIMVKKENKKGREEEGGKEDTDEGRAGVREQVTGMRLHSTYLL